MGANKKHEIIKVAQENLYMLKRLNERTSFYNVEKWNKDYEVSQYYKKNLCLYSPIDFNKTQRFGAYQNSWGIETGSTPKKSYTNRKKFFAKTNYDGINTIDIPEYKRFANSTQKRKKFEDFNYRDLELEEKKNKNKNKNEEEKVFKKISEIENVEPEQEKEKQNGQEKQPEKEENKDNKDNNNNLIDEEENKENKDKSSVIIEMQNMGSENNENINNKSNISDNQISTLPCGHRYHVKCITEWMLRKKSICPMCREKMDVSISDNGDEEDLQNELLNIQIELHPAFALLVFQTINEELTWGAMALPAINGGLFAGLGGFAFI